MNDQDLSFSLRRALARHHPSAFLLAAQLLSLPLYAAFDGAHSGRILLGAFGIVVMLLAVWVVNHTPAIDWIVWIVAVPALVLALLSALIVDPTLLAWSSLLEAALYFYAAASLIAYMMGDHKVTTDELFAAGATFTLIAWGFAYLYLVCQIWYPGSFIGGTNPGQSRTFLELLFLSFTNLSAVGVGDVLPITAAGRVLVMFEQFVGVAYIAVVVSRLIGLTIVRRERERRMS